MAAGSARRLIMAVLVLALSMGLAGCWNRRELETLGIVSAAGIDYNEETGFYELTVHVIKPRGGTESNMTEKAYVQVLATGRTVFEAVRNVIQQLPARLFWSHNNVLIIGEETARRGVTDVLDFFERDGETRHSVIVIVAEGMSANDLMKAAYELDDQPGMQMVEHVGFVRGSLSTTLAVQLHDFLIRLLGEGIEPIAVRIKAALKQPVDLPGDLMRETVGLTPIVGGMAVFRDDRMLGWLEPLEARGVLWLTGQTKGGILVVNDPWHDYASIGLELARSSAEVEFIGVPGGGIRARVVIRASAYLGDVQAPIAPLHMSAFESLMEASLEAGIRAEAVSALTRCQGEYRSDILGWGAALHRQDPDLWRTVKDDWEELFPQIEVEIDVHGAILRSGKNTSYRMVE